MTLQDSPSKYYETNTCVSSYMFIVSQIYSAADVCERFNIELKTVAAFRPPSPPT